MVALLENVNFKNDILHFKKTFLKCLLGIFCLQKSHRLLNETMLTFLKASFYTIRGILEHLIQIFTSLYMKLDVHRCFECNF